MTQNTSYLRDERTGDTCIRILHPSGLEIRVMEQPGFSTAYAQFGTHYGSIHARFRKKGEAAFTEVPAGIAHFLEHKLFENQDSDVTTQFVKLGASDNAYTTFDRTAYLFHTSRNFPEALELLLQFVQQPYFTQESVEKERNIIAQEIQEYLDLPSDRLFFQMLEGLYHNHPVRTDVAGTLESIRQITPELLYQCYHTFYNLHNMVLCCAGNITAEQVLAAADRVLIPAPPMQAETAFLPEPPEVAAPYRHRKMAVGKPLFSIGFKSRPVDGIERLRDSALAALTLDLLIGAASPLYQKLLAEGLINDVFSTDCFTGEGWFTCIAEGESDQPQAVLDALLVEIERAKLYGLDEKLFAILKRSAYGDTVMGMNTPEAAAAAMLDSFMWDRLSPFERTSVLSALTIEDAQACLCERFRADRVCLSVIEPDTAQPNRKEISE